MDNSVKSKRAGKKAKGGKEWFEYAEKKLKLPPNKAILARCYECTGGYTDGRYDCQVEDCPLYPYMPYRKNLVKVKRAMSEKQKEAFQRMSDFPSRSRGTESVVNKAEKG